MKNDPFRFYTDGEHRISKRDYIDFYFGACNEYISCNYKYVNDIVMLKKNGCYMFFGCNPSKRNLYILAGGQNAGLADESLEYYYENMDIYVEAICSSLKPDQQEIKKISEQVRHFGGSGLIHGSIVDIDGYNHIMLDPLGNGIAYYFAYSMVDKWQYNSLEDLLRNRLPQLYENYMLSVKRDVPAKKTRTKKAKYISDTSMYSYSRKMLNYRVTMEKRVVRNWNKDVLEKYTKQLNKGFLDSAQISLFQK